MAVFEDEKLRDEEIKSGFTPGSPDDDSFQLEKMDNYPGEIRFPENYSEIDDLTTDKSQESTNDYESKQLIDSSEESPGDLLAEKISQPEEVTQAFIVDEPIIKDFELYEDEIIESPEIIAENSENSDQEINNSNIEASENSIAGIKSEEDAAIAVDDELKALIQKELEKSKSKQIVETQEDEISDEQPLELPDIDSEKEFEIINISEIDADRPSTYFPKEEAFETLENNNEPPPIMDITKPTKKPAVKPDDSGEIKEKKRRKPIPWKLLIIPAVAALSLIIIGSLSYIFLFDENSDFYLFRLTTDTLISTTKKLDTPKITSTRTESTISDTLKTALTKPEVKQDTIIKKYDTDKTIISQKTKEKVSEKIATTEKPRKERIETKKPDYAYKPIDKPVVPLQQTKTEIYTIQVYASPSKEDAEEWLERLKAMNIENAFISTQKIRDRIWYRVRFGNFNTREEARSMALRYGFAQSWIDRVQ